MEVQLSDMVTLCTYKKQEDNMYLIKLSGKNIRFQAEHDPNGLEIMIPVSKFKGKSKKEKK